MKERAAAAEEEERKVKAKREKEKEEQSGVQHSNGNRSGGKEGSGNVLGDDGDEDVIF